MRLLLLRSTASSGEISSKEDRGWRVEDREKRIENNGCKRMVHGAVV
jgi:predicted component of type VI protein secretion system